MNPYESPSYVVENESTDPPVTRWVVARAALRGGIFGGKWGAVFTGALCVIGWFAFAGVGTFRWCTSEVDEDWKIRFFLYLPILFLFGVVVVGLAALAFALLGATVEATVAAIGFQPPVLAKSTARSP